MDSLFEEPKPDRDPEDGPLAERMRPEILGNFIGQEHLMGPGRALRLAIERDKIPSMILWGPPGVGKTTLARIIAHMTKSEFLTFSAVLSGIRQIKDIMALAERSRHHGRRTILFIDEIHRFNKAQQDAFLPYVEKGSITLIGATTENPSFEVIAALLSRVRVFVLNPLNNDEILSLIGRASERFDYRMAPDAARTIVELANGDARTAYNILELASESIEADAMITKETLQEVAHKKVLIYDKSGEEHYNIISALHKSIRNSDADAALYWLARMLDAGEDPMYVARRLVRFASEDIGLADPAALGVALDVKEAVAFLGMPEGQLALAECAIYLAASPKSNAVYTAYSAALEDARHGRVEPVPLHLRNAPTRLMKKLHYGEGYQYAHANKEQVARMECLPASVAGHRYYRPKNAGSEIEVKRRLDEFERRKKKQQPE